MKVLVIWLQHVGLSAPRPPALHCCCMNSGLQFSCICRDSACRHVSSETSVSLAALQCSRSLSTSAQLRLCSNFQLHHINDIQLLGEDSEKLVLSQKQECISQKPLLQVRSGFAAQQLWLCCMCSADLLTGFCCCRVLHAYQLCFHMWSMTETETVCLLPPLKLRPP